MGGLEFRRHRSVAVMADQRQAVHRDVGRRRAAQLHDELAPHPPISELASFVAAIAAFCDASSEAGEVGVVLGGHDPSTRREGDRDAEVGVGLMGPQHTCGAEVAAPVARHHLVADPHVLDRPRRSVAHGDLSTGDQALIRVADHHHVAALFGEEPHHLPLRDVGVLELVDEHVMEAFLPTGQRVGVLLEQLHREHEQVVEVERGRLGQALLVDAVHLGDALLGRGERLLDRLFPGDEVVLHRRDRGLQTAGRETLGVEVEVASHVVGQAHRVGLVVDRELRAVPEHGRLASQDARAHRVKRRHPHLLGDGADEIRDPFLHLAGGLVGEGDRREPEGRHAVLGHEERDAVGEHAGLARTRARDHEDRAVGRRRRLTLDGVEPLEDVGRRDHPRIVPAPAHTFGVPASTASNDARKERVRTRGRGGARWWAPPLHARPAAGGCGPR